MSEQGHLLTAHCRNCSGTCFRACEGKLECYHCALESELSSLRAEVERLRAAHEEDNELVKDAKLAANHWRDRATKAEAALSEARKGNIFT